MQNLKFKKILDTLSEGNTRFVSGRSKGPDTSPAHRKTLLMGQRPMAAVVSCADSRVSPEIIFDQGLGDLFILRTAGNLVDQLELESIDYAVRHLSVSVVLILGHTHCGAVTAVSGLKEIAPDDGKIANLLKPAIENAHHFSQDPIEGAVLANVTRTVSRLNQMEQFATLVAEQTLLICGAIYHLENGKVRFI